MIFFSRADAIKVILNLPEDAVNFLAKLLTLSLEYFIDVFPDVGVCCIEGPSWVTDGLFEEFAASNMLGFALDKVLIPCDFHHPDGLDFASVGIYIYPFTLIKPLYNCDRTFMQAFPKLIAIVEVVRY